MNKEPAEKIIDYVVTITKPRWITWNVDYADLDDVFIPRGYEQGGFASSLFYDLLKKKQISSINELGSILESYEGVNKYDRQAAGSLNGTFFRDGMDMTGWLEYFTEGLQNQLAEVRKKGEKAIKKEVIIERAERFDLNERQQKILIYLLEEKRGSVNDIKQKFNLIRRTIQRDLSKLVELGLIKEVAKSKTDPTRYYELL